MAEKHRSCMLAVGEAPSRSPKPATLLRNLLVAIEARDLLPATLCEGLGQCALGNRVAAPRTRKNRHRRNPGGKIIVTATLNSKDRASARHALGQNRAETLV